MPLCHQQGCVRVQASGRRRKRAGKNGSKVQSNPQAAEHAEMPPGHLEPDNGTEVFVRDSTEVALCSQRRSPIPGILLARLPQGNGMVEMRCDV
ncbi:unnamed protein product, partial [Lampetra planeri]